MRTKLTSMWARSLVVCGGVLLFPAACTEDPGAGGITDDFGNTDQNADDLGAPGDDDTTTTDDDAAVSDDDEARDDDSGSAAQGDDDTAVDDDASDDDTTTGGAGDTGDDDELPPPGDDDAAADDDDMADDDSADDDMTSDDDTAAECGSDFDCGDGYVCMQGYCEWDGGGGSGGIGPGECDTDADCAEGEVCSEYLCIPADVDCADPEQNPIPNSCFLAFFGDCFDPDGACTSDDNGNTTWSNGAHTEVEFSGSGGTVAYINSAGETCVSGTMEVDMSSGTVHMEMSNQAGETLLIDGDESGTSTYTCPDGSSFTSTQRDDAVASYCDPRFTSCE